MQMFQMHPVAVFTEYPETSPSHVPKLAVPPPNHMFTPPVEPEVPVLAVYSSLVSLFPI